jgi:hypothetical protein
MTQPIEIETDTERLELAIRRSGQPKWVIGAEAGMSAPQISDVLSGKKIPSRGECLALAAAVKQDVKAIFPDTLQQHAMDEKGPKSA